jgi:hypothetical protein
VRDNTGLKGLAADFARSELEDDKLPTSPAGQVLAKIGRERGTGIPNGLDKIVTRRQIFVVLGRLNLRATSAVAKNGAPLLMSFDHDTGMFHEPGRSSDIPGLFGAGNPTAWTR